jgi:Holliday junction resolvase
MSGAGHRRKGDRLEREIVARHRALGIHSERYPLSGATRFRGQGHDVDVYPFGTSEAPIVAEVKGRRNGSGFVTLEKWLGTYDAGPSCSNGGGDEPPAARENGSAN